jgi:hypothetical protein
MANWMQHVVVICAVVLSAGVLVRGAMRRKIGSCCAKGCESAKPQAANRIVFLPVEALLKRK